MNDCQILKLHERLDSENVGELKKNVENAITANVSGLILDFASTKFIDSIGLGSLVSLLKKTAQNNIKIVLCSLSPQVKQIFELTKLHSLFDIFDSIEDVKETFKT